MIGSNFLISFYVTSRLCHWQLALRDIDMAERAKVPHPSPLKLMERKAKCQQMLGDPVGAVKTLEDIRSNHPDKAQETDIQIKKIQDVSAETTDDLSLEMTGSKGHPGLSTAVQIKEEPSRGRFGVAARDIKAGEVLIVEEATAARLKSGDDIKSHCENCLR